MAAALCLAGLACGGDGPGAIVEVSGSGLQVGQDIDGITIRVTASRTGVPDELCEPFVLPLSLDPGADDHVTLPFTLGVNQGSEYGEQLFVQVEATLQGQVRYRLEQSASLSGGKVRLRFSLDQSCLDTGVEPGQACRDGLAVPSDMPFFSDPAHPWIRAGERCVP